MISRNPANSPPFHRIFYGHYTRGVGTTGLRVRFACPPELAILTLRTAREVPANEV